MIRDSSQSKISLFAMHSRSWRENFYVYPVVSRRSRGLSIGVNLNPNKACSFDCPYCQVDRTVAPTVREVDPNRLREELDRILDLAAGGQLYDSPEFGRIPENLRRINDIAFSGDGEPTASSQFPVAVRIAAELKSKHGLEEARIVLITNAAHLHQPPVREALLEMDRHNGEIWAKLDAGTEAYFRQVNRTSVPMKQVLDNIRDAAMVRPIVIQSMWMSVHGEPPPVEELDAFAQQLRCIVESGGRIKLVQLYTIARGPAESWVAPLPEAELARIDSRIRRTVDLPTAVFGG